MESYAHFQVGWTVVVILVLIFAFIFFYYRNRPKGRSSIIWSAAVVVVVLLLFYGMRVKIEGQQLNLSYGIGIIGKSIDLTKVQSCEVSSYGWRSGVGVRIMKDKTLYNVGGGKAVTIKLSDSPKLIMIGTDEPEMLKQAIDRAAMSTREKR